MTLHTITFIRSVADLLESIEYKGWDIAVRLDGYRPYLQVAFKALNPETGESEAWTGRKWFLSPHMTESEVVQTAFKAVLTAEEHEAREAFTWKGKAIFGPHIDINALWDACEALDVRVAA